MSFLSNYKVYDKWELHDNRQSKTAKTATATTTAAPAAARAAAAATAATTTPKQSRYHKSIIHTQIHTDKNLSRCVCERESSATVGKTRFSPNSYARSSICVCVLSALLPTICVRVCVQQRASKSRKSINNKSNKNEKNNNNDNDYYYEQRP